MEDVAEKSSLAEDFAEKLLGCAPYSVGDLLHTFDDLLNTWYYHVFEDWVDGVVEDGVYDLAYTVRSGTYDLASPFQEHSSCVSDGADGVA